MAYIQLNNVSYKYPEGFLAVDKLSMGIEQGESVAIIGQNGAGKTTTVKMMNGLLKPMEGDVTIGDMNTKNFTTAQVSRKVGYVFQNPDDQIFHSSVYDEIAFGPKKMNMDPVKRERFINYSLKWTGLKEHRHENPYNLPLSIRKFVTIASSCKTVFICISTNSSFVYSEVSQNNKLPSIIFPLSLILNIDAILFIMSIY